MSKDENKRTGPKRQLLSPLLDTQQNLFDCGFKIVRKRRATVQDVKSLSPTSKTPRRRSSGFLRPDCSRRPSKELSEQDFVLQEDNLVSQPDELESFQHLATGPIRRPLGTCSLLPGNERRPSAIKNARRNEMESPVSFRTKRCASLSLASRRESRGLRERNRSVNGYNIPKMKPTELKNLTGQLKETLKTTQSGKHSDLRYINDETLVQLMHGEKKAINKTTIIDARYPYEYRGGHITGAINLYTADMLEQYFYDINKENQTSGTHVIIFHCEFSSERAPALLRCLRRVDRARNCYPALDFPELYLLKGGYKNFFENQLSMTSGTYLPMLDSNHANDLRHFRKKCKTAPSDKI